MKHYYEVADMQVIIDLLIKALDGQWSCIKTGESYTINGLNGREIEITKDNNRIIAQVNWPWMDGYRFDPESCGITGVPENAIQETWRTNTEPGLIVEGITSNIFQRLETIYPEIETCYLDHKERRSQLVSRMDELQFLLGGEVYFNGLEAVLSFSMESGVSGRIVVENQITITHSIELHQITPSVADAILYDVASRASQ
ncbi:MAG: hypothetical protein G8D89_22305 [gamma proteobacterium symbiont of Clathrolucina costata]